MENMEDDNIRSTDSEVNMSDSSVLWGEYFTTTSYPLFTFASDSVSVVKNASNMSSVAGGGVFESDLIVPLYVVIFVLAIVGNSLVLITLAQNKRMRTVTNVYLLNLVSSFTFVTFLCYLLNLSSFLALRNVTCLVLFGSK
jgi:cholecystokinin-like receptor